MHQIFVNNEIYYINDFDAIYNLKESIMNKKNICIDDQILYYNGKILKNDKTFVEYNIKDNDHLIVNSQLKGGFDTLSLIFWIIYICIFFYYLILLISGIIPIIAYSYEYILNWAMLKLGTLFALTNNQYFSSFITVILFIFSVGIIYFFVYVLTTFMIFPIFYKFSKKTCDAVKSSTSVGFWVAITFIIIYALFNIPNFFLKIASNATEINFFISVFIQPFLGLLENIANIGKFAGIYAIPFVGTPFLFGYHFAVSLVSTIVKEGIDYSKLFSCADTQKMEELGKVIRAGIKNKTPLYDWIKSYHAEKMAESITIGLIPDLY